MTITTKTERAEKAAQEFSQAVNEMNFDAKAFAREIRKDHRTQQQNTMRVFMEVISQWADDAEIENFDLRNQDTVTLAKKIIDAIPSRYLQYV